MLRWLLKAGLVLAIAIALFAGFQQWRNSGNTALLTPPADSLRLATYNVHYISVRRETGAWSLGDWERRKTPLDLAFKTVDADAIGFQEMESFSRGDESQLNLTLDWLLENNPAYAAAAVGDPHIFPSTQPILYRTARLRLVDQGWFFFSQTPDVIYSRTFNGSFPAFASWAQFQDRTSGEMFRMVNLHTDYGSRTNRLSSVALVARRIAPWIARGEVVVLTGDLNARHGAQTIDILEEIGLTFANIAGSTYHFNHGANLFGAIDHIGFSSGVDLVAPAVVLRQKFAGEWPTDHYPVVVDMAFDR
ncbi:MAG: endonuclease [Robiginitomaculum sp.]|nr:MAG: endonuclease [Robiginitomaculum sp.]